MTGKGRGNSGPNIHLEELTFGKFFVHGGDNGKMEKFLAVAINGYPNKSQKGKYIGVQKIFKTFYTFKNNKEQGNIFETTKSI